MQKIKEMEIEVNEEYKKKMLDNEIERKILESEEDYNNGRVRKVEDVFREWKLKYGSGRNYLDGGLL